jgi:hypothetical protein
VTALRSVFALSFLIVGCNSILDNTRGQPRPEDNTTDIPATEPAPIPDAASPIPPRPDTGQTPACPAGQRACNGACVNLDDPAHGCSDPTCTPCAIAHGGARCVNGACTAATCDPGWGDCNGKSEDGCETDLTLPTSCGSCATACSEPAPVCAPSGATRACASGCPAEAPLRCGGACVSPLTNVAHCGGCDRPCPDVPKANSTCVAGVCTFTCKPGSHACLGQCVQDDDPATCGPACTVCPVFPNTRPTCTNGVCAFTCLDGWADCNLAPADGCETSILTDPLHCGGCGIPCVGTCVGGRCRPMDGG